MIVEIYVRKGPEFAAAWDVRCLDVPDDTSDLHLECMARSLLAERHGITFGWREIVNDEDRAVEGGA